MIGIERKQFQRHLQFRRELRVLIGIALGGPNKCFRRKQKPFHAKMRLTICFGVAGWQRPSSNSRRADLTASIKASRRRSARRRCKTSTSDSCSSTPNSSAESNTCANVFMPVKIGWFACECKTRRARLSLHCSLRVRLYGPDRNSMMKGYNWHTVIGWQADTGRRHASSPIISNFASCII